MNYRKFRFKKDFVCSEGTLREGSEIVLIDDKMYFDGGMVNPLYYDNLMKIITSPILNKEYLKEVFINPEAYVTNIYE